MTGLTPRDVKGNCPRPAFQLTLPDQNFMAVIIFSFNHTIFHIIDIWMIPLELSKCNVAHPLGKNKEWRSYLLIMMMLL
jgi:hypothetical protein